MISAQAWWGVIQNYQLKIFPAQILLYLLGCIIPALFLHKPSAVSGRRLKAFFMLCFAWIGFVFFLVLGRQLPAHSAQSILFLSLAALFGADWVFGITDCSPPAAGWRRTALWIGFGLVIGGYPLAGLLHGHPLSQWLLPGAFPCPTTALALLCMAFARPTRLQSVHWAAMGLLLLWAIPFPLLIQIPTFGVFEDGIMAAAGLFAVAVRFADKKRASASARPD